ncbi:MAG TPA: T9SS type A sorting domain-containing protein [Flavobacteriales bacterium]
MRIFLTISIWLLWLNCCKAQQFSILYDYNNFANDGVSLARLSDGYIVTTNGFDIGSQRYSVIIARFNQQGELIWERSLTDEDDEWSHTSGATSCIIPRPDLNQNWLFCNKHLDETTVIPAILKFDVAGNHLDTILFNEFFGIHLLTISSVVTNETLFLLCQPMNSSTNYIIRCNSNGEPLSHFTSPIGFQSDTQFITDVGDGLVIGGRYLPNAVSNISFQYVRKLDYDGNVLWTNEYNNNGLSTYGAVNALALDNGNVLFASSHSQGDPDMLRFQPYIGEIDDLTGDTLWTKRYLNPDSTNRLHNFKRLSSGEYIGVGETFQYSPGIAALPYVTMAYIMKLDSEFNLLWYRYYTPTGYVGGPFLDPVCHLNDFVENEDGGITALGRAFTYTGTGLQSGYIQDSWLLRVDSDGCLVSGCAVDVTEYEATNDLFVYPNPATDRLNIEFPHIDKWHVSIYNMQGALVKEEQPHQLLHYSIGVQELPSGVYSLLCHDSQGKTFSHKIIKH